MSSAFLKMKKDRARVSQKRLDAMKNENSGGQSYQDDRMYYPERDDKGNGYAVIRFLAAKNPTDLPFTKVFEHGFKEDGGWYIENCPTTIGKECPVCKANSEQWQLGNKSIARKRKRTKKYYANIYVVSDPKNPDNEGKVFLFKFGQAIFDILMSASNPEFEDETPIDPFDLWDGADFKLKIVKKDGQTNYDRSEFGQQKPLAESDEEIERIWSQQYDLSEFTAPEQFKDYDTLAKRFARVTGSMPAGETADEVPTDNARRAPSQSRSDNRATDDAGDTPPFNTDDDEGEDQMPDGVEDDDDEDPMAFFEKQANQ